MKIKAYSTIHRNHNSTMCPKGNRVYFKPEAAYNAIQGRTNFVVCSIDIELDNKETKFHLNRSFVELLEDKEITKVLNG